MDTYAIYLQNFVALAATITSQCRHKAIQSAEILQFAAFLGLPTGQAREMGV